MPCCNAGTKLKEEYDNAIKLEALTWARLIAHKRRHEDVHRRPAVHHMQVVNEIARQYAEGDAKAFDEIPPT